MTILQISHFFFFLLIIVLSDMIMEQSVRDLFICPSFMTFPTELWRDFLYTFVNEVLYLAKFVFECVTLQIKYPFAGYFRRLP